LITLGSLPPDVENRASRAHHTLQEVNFAGLSKMEKPEPSVVRANVADIFHTSPRGLYIIAPDSNPVDEAGVWYFKVGRSESIAKRISEYKVYFPYGSHILAVAPIKDESNLVRAEKEFFRFLPSKNAPGVQTLVSSRRSEWYVARWNNMVIAVKKLKNEWKNKPTRIMPTNA